MTHSRNHASKRTWNLELLAEAEPGRRNRRTIDGVLLAQGAFVVGLTAVIAKSAPVQDANVGQAVVTVLGWAPAVCRVALLGALALALAIVVDVPLRRRWTLARDIAVALIVLGGLACVLGRVVEADWVPVEADIFARWGFPELRRRSERSHCQRNQEGKAVRRTRSSTNL